ncbi:hypothetical protein C8R44DRAFT_643694 [Mycena epipterygia]|nr:hypothetical protein C8R44DRAFT_643694 [Mycena epipterygia]
MSPTTLFLDVIPGLLRESNWTWDICPDDYYLIYNGRRLSLNATPITAGCSSEATINFSVKLKGGKPVIYLFAPNVMDAAVRLTLTRDWDLSAVYPIVQKTKSIAGGDAVEWQVRVHPDGTLTERTTGLDVAYLFWEALTNHDVPMTPSGSPLLNPVEPSIAQSESFSPTTCDLTPADSVLLSINTITPYLDEALGKLGLHTEARTSFITYWLPSFLKHTHVALRFVAQAIYERSARLEIPPAPDVVTRVFMIFKGVAELDVVAGEWNKEAGDPARWRDVVGLDVGRAGDASLFRVLEWGGLEVVGR